VTQIIYASNRKALGSADMPLWNKENGNCVFWRKPVDLGRFHKYFKHQFAMRHHNHFLRSNKELEIHNHV